MQKYQFDQLFRLTGVTDVDSDADIDLERQTSASHSQVNLQFSVTEVKLFFSSQINIECQMIFVCPRSLSFRKTVAFQTIEL